MPREELACFADRCLEMTAIAPLFATLLALAFLGASAACAQAPGAEPRLCAKPGGDSSKTLSEKLDRSGGVICPPNVDPGMKAPAPETGKMPVIPPSGSPGGNPQVRPK